MTRTMFNRSLSVGVAGILSVAAVAPVTAAPILSNTLAVKSAVVSDVTDVRWRRGPGLAFGAIAGLALGAAIAGSQPYYYGPPAYGYYGGPPVYAYPPPVYYGDYGRSYDSRGFYEGHVDTNAIGNW